MMKKNAFSLALFLCATVPFASAGAQEANPAAPEATPTAPPVVRPPALYQADYGTRLAAGSDLWWCESARKVGRERALPASGIKSDFVPLELARNEYEAVQVVARPEKDVHDVTAKIDDLIGPHGARIAAKNVTVDQVEYVGVQFPSDSSGATGYWPDPLPPLKQPIALKANRNQPFWITVFAPKDIPGGVYRGVLRLSGKNWQRRVPLQVTVWGFTLTDETHIRSGLGLTPGRIAPYHNVAGDELLQVVDKYHANYAQHRISPYYPHFGYDIKVDWGPISLGPWGAGTLDAEQPFAGNRSMRIEDKNAKGVVSATSPRLTITARHSHLLKFAVRTAQENQTYRVSLMTYDANGRWLNGNNLDFDRQGSMAWQTVRLDVTKHLADIRVYSFTIVMYPVKWTEDGEETGTAWFDNVQLIEDSGNTGGNTGDNTGDNTGAGTDLLRDAGTFDAIEKPVTAEQVKLDFSAFDPAIERAIREYHITGFRVPMEAGFVGSQANYTAARIGGYPQGSPEFNILFDSYLKQLQAHLEAKGWLDLAYLYWADEPRPSIYDELSEMRNLIHRSAPKLKWLLTLTHNDPKEPLVQLLDIWCPLLSNFNTGLTEQFHRQGKEVWWYICVVPKTPYVGEFIDHEAIEPRLWLWQTWQNKVDGILIWTTVFWTNNGRYPNSYQNPWEDPMSWNSATGGLGNGDGRFFYPPNRDPNNDKRKFIEGPINSMRWELLRDGIEDYEYFWTLQQRVNALEKRTVKTVRQTAWLARARELLIVPDAISTSLTQYTKDPQVLLQRRAQIAQAIVEAGEL